MDTPFLLSLNTSTLRPYHLAVDEQITTAAAAGFDGIELWLRDIRSYIDSGNTTTDIRTRSEDGGIQIVNGITFFRWTDRDPSVRTRALQDAKAEMTMLAEIGCTAVAAPPTGDVEGVSIEQIAECFDALREVAAPIGVTPVLEFWGRSSVLHSIALCRAVLEASSCDACPMLLDLFHMYTGGSSVDEIRSLSATDIGIVHMNDYPGRPPREEITDLDRVMPGDGVGPTGEFLRALSHVGFVGPLSVELFRNEYPEADPVATARTAREKTLQCWEKSGE